MGEIYVVCSQPNFVTQFSRPLCYFPDYPSALAFAKSIYRHMIKPADVRDMVYMITQGTTAATTPTTTPTTTTPTITTPGSTPLTTSTGTN